LRTIWLGLLILAALGTALEAGAAELVVPLEFYDFERAATAEEAGTRLFAPGSQSPILLASPPEGEWTLPEITSRKPVYTLVRLGDREHLLVLDADEPDGFYTKVLFDADADRDLTDDPALPNAHRGEVRLEGGARGRFLGPVRTEILVDGTKLPYSFTVRIFCWNAWEEVLGEGEVTEEIDVALDTNCALRGSVTIDGKSFGVVLGDSNADGRFGEPSGRSLRDPGQEFTRLFPGGDALYLSASEKVGYLDRLPFGELLLVGADLFAVRVDQATRKLILTPVKEGRHTLDLAAEPERMALASEDGRCLMAFRPGGKPAIPAGTWRLVEYTLLREDAQGDGWRLMAAATAATPFVRLGEASDAKLAFGEPFVPLAHVPAWSREAVVNQGAEQASVEFAVEGAAREVLTDLARVSGRKTEIAMSAKKPERPNEPLYKIVQPNGEIAAKGRFEYG
jgi:hypothetical protein